MSRVRTIGACLCAPSLLSHSRVAQRIKLKGRAPSCGPPWLIRELPPRPFGRTHAAFLVRPMSHALALTRSVHVLSLASHSHTTPRTYFRKGMVSRGCPWLAGKPFLKPFDRYSRGSLNRPISHMRNLTTSDLTTCSVRSCACFSRPWAADPEEPHPAGTFTVPEEEPHQCGAANQTSCAM